MGINSVVKFYKRKQFTSHKVLCNNFQPVPYENYNPEVSCHNFYNIETV